MVTDMGCTHCFPAALGILAFLIPLGLLQVSVARDRVSTVTLGAYTVYVVAYDVPWAYQLWRLNPAELSDWSRLH